MGNIFSLMMCIYKKLRPASRSAFKSRGADIFLLNSEIQHCCQWLLPLFCVLLESIASTTGQEKETMDINIKGEITQKPREITVGTLKKSKGHQSVYKYPISKLNHNSNLS